jgi:copper resistance protein C
MSARIKIAPTIAGVCALLLIASPAWAHGDVVNRSPQDGATLGRAPRRVAVTLSETPVADSTLRVEDGCGRQVSEDVAVEADTIVARIGDAQPGRWNASWQAISAVDGHPTEGAWRFTVRGDRDCTPEKPNKDATPEPTEGPADGATVSHEGHNTATGADEDGSSFPMMPVALGAVGIIGLAVIARRFGAR